MKRKNTMIHVVVHHNKLQIWPIYGLLVTFMAFKLKLIAFPIKLTPNGPQTRGKIIEKSNFTLQPLPLSSKKISVFFNFFESLDAYIRSLLICENHKSELYFTISDYFYHCVLGTLVLFISMVNSQFYFF